MERTLPREPVKAESAGNPDPRILIADDQLGVIEALRLFLKGQGYQIETANSPVAVLQAVEARAFDVLLIDLNYTRDTTSGREGLDLLAQLHGWDSTLPIVVMTAWASIELVVEAMQEGARDFVQKPWDNARLLTILRNQVDLGRALRKGQRLETENRLLRGDGPSLIAQSAAMRPVLEIIERVGPSDANILIRGENGTGKGVVAQAIHAISRRASRPMVAVNIGGLSEGVFESELFGHVRGAFTDAKSDRVGRFELAEGGTLFLDEIANLTMQQQAKLLRVLEMGEYERVGSSQTRKADFRLLSATNAPLEQEVENGRFRQDLLFRLNTVEIRIPPIRDRRDDIPALAGHFLQQHAMRYRKSIEGFEDGAMKQLLQHAWPGNVRELDHAIERAVLMSTASMIRSSDLGLQVPADSTTRIEEMSLEDVEALLIKKSLVRYDGNVSRAAEALGLSRSALYRRLQRYGL
ncbi:MAG: sigma-54-dependent transcriptional regulator [Thermoanaerobaculia bacterium]